MRACRVCWRVCRELPRRWNAGITGFEMTSCHVGWCAGSGTKSSLMSCLIVALSASGSVTDVWCVAGWVWARQPLHHHSPSHR